MNARTLTAALASLLALGAIALSGAPVALADEACPNAQLRSGYSAALPDCRAYELVTPAGSEPFLEVFGRPGGTNAEQGDEVAGEARGARAASTGGRLAYFSAAAPPGARSDGPYYLASRTPTGWSTTDSSPPQSTTSGQICFTGYAAGYSADLSRAVLADGFEQERCGRDEPAVIPGEPLGYQNLFAHDYEAGTDGLIDLTPADVAPRNAWFQAASSDLSHILFTEDDAAPLTAQAPTGGDRGTAPEQLLPTGEDLYDWTDGAVRLVTLLPDGTPTMGALANAHPYTSAQTPGLERLESAAPEYTHSISTDGSRVFWTTVEQSTGGLGELLFPRPTGFLYVRENPDQPQSALGEKGECTEPAKACSELVDAPESGCSQCTAGGAKFMWASADGSKVFFTDENQLTSDARGGSGQNLYQFDVDTHRLTDLTASADARVLGVSGVGETDAGEASAYVYFAAEGVLSGAVNSQGASASAGQPNLYLWHEGATTFIATLEAGASAEASLQGADGCDWTSACITARVSPNGAYIGFDSIGSPTGYDNTLAEGADEGSCGDNTYPSSQCQEIYLYSAAAHELSCVSCDPSGARPSSPAGIRLPTTTNLGIGGELPGYPQRNVLDNGRVIFDTAQPLLPNDTNGGSDVYEYENGQLHLLSSPTGGASYFYDASASGDDVFILTAQHLLAQDTAAVSVYDARVDGGFPEASSLAACGEEDCKGSLSAAPSFSAPSSATFAGVGNQVAPPAAAVKPKAKPVKCKRGHARKRGKKCETKRKVKRRPKHGNRRSKRASHNHGSRA